MLIFFPLVDTYLSAINTRQQRVMSHDEVKDRLVESDGAD